MKIVSNINPLRDFILAMYIYNEYLIAMYNQAEMDGNEEVASILIDQVAVYEQQINELKEIDKSLSPSSN